MRRLAALLTILIAAALLIGASAGPQRALLSNVPSWVLADFGRLEAAPQIGVACEFDRFRCWQSGRPVGNPTSFLTVTRASVAYEDDTAGNWYAFPSGQLRLTNKGILSEASTTNSERNNSGTGASGTTASAVVNSQGAGGYTNNDVVTVVGGTFTTATKLTLTVSGGNITGVAINTAGSYTKFPSTPSSGVVTGVSVTGGTGSGATFNLTIGAGTLPTNWSVLNAANLSTNVSEVGTESGIDYIDLQVTGTSNATTYRIAFETSAGISASAAQVWDESLFGKLSSGAFTNVTNWVFDAQTYTSVPALIQENNSGTQTNPTAAALTSQRHSAAITIAGASTAAVRPTMAFTISNASSINFTIRIGWTQMEHNGFASSPIRTTSAAVARAADVISFKNPPAMSINGSSMTVTYSPEAAGYTVFGRIISINDGTNNNEENLIVVGDSSGTVVGTVTAGGSTRFTQPNSSAQAAFSQNKWAMAFAPASYAGSYNGGAVATGSTAGALPVVSGITIGNGGPGDGPFSGYISSFSVLPGVRVPNQAVVNGST